MGSACKMSKSKIRFAAFELDYQNGELRKHGLRIKLQDQPFKILVALIEKPDEIVSRDELRQRLWGSDTFVDFDRGLSAAVNRLRDALGDSADKPRYVETVARRGYRFIGLIEAAPEPVIQPVAAVKTRHRLNWVALVSLLLATAITAAGLWRVLGQRNLPALLTQVTALTGSETMPTFSPDGGQVAFVWNGEKEGNADIYVKMTGSESALRLTSHPGADLLPSWSPDGHQIAFVRVEGKTGIYLVSPLGGTERKLIELPGFDHRPPGPETKVVGDLLYPIVNRPSWSADGKFLAIARNSEPPEPGDGAVMLVPVDGGEPRTILAAERDTKYRHPVFAPDGRSMAVVFCSEGAGVSRKCQIQIVPLSADLLPQGEPRTILPDCKLLRGVAWMPDGQSLIIGGFDLPHYYLWRVSAYKQTPPERIELAGADAIWPAISHNNGRLAFARSILQADIYRLERGGKSNPFLSSTVRDTSAQFSVDGRRIAFQSARGGSNDIWVAQADGTGLMQITRLGNSGSPRWSPDGKQVAFDSIRKDGMFEVWTVEAEGGSPRRLTNGANGNSPSWSGNGKWLYFLSNRSGRMDIWRTPFEGGASEQITRKGGFVGLESNDGKTLYYTKSNSGSEGIYAMPIRGGEENNIISDLVVRGSFAVVPEGIYYITTRDENMCEIRLHEFALGRSRVVAEIERPIAFGLSVSPDQKTFLYSRPITGSDLMLIENFR